MTNKKGIEYFIVEGGHDGDPDPEEAGRIRTRQMGAHGKSVKTEHLPFNQTLKSGGNHFHRPPAPGTIMAGYVPKGAEFTGYAHLLGAFSTKQESGVSAPGNEVLPFLDKAQNIELKIKLPPNVKALLEENRTGLQKFKKEIEEKGEKFKQATLRGLPGDGAIFALSGIRNTPIKNISTAIDKVVDQMSSSKLAQLPAGIGSLDLNSIISQLISSLDDIPANLKETLESFVKTATGDLNSVSPPGASLGNLVNQAAFLTKALDLMKDAKTSGDVIRAIQKLQHPDLLAETLTGIDEITFDVDSIYGKISQTLNASGELANIANSFIDDIKTALQGLLANIPGAGSAGESFFTADGTPIPDLIERLKDTSGAKALKEAVEKVSSANNTKKAKQRTNNNGSGKGATQDIIFSAMQLVARDGRIIPFLPTDSTGESSGQLPSLSTPEANPDVADDDAMLVYSAFNAANVAFIHANSAFNAVNAISGGANVTPAFDQANAAYTQANVAYTVAVGSFAGLNAEIIRGTSTFATVNSETTRLTSAFGAANGALLVAQGAFAAANASPATAAFDQANVALSTAQSAFGALNTETTRGTSTFAALNAETTRLTSAYATINSEVAALDAEIIRGTSTYATVNSETTRLTSAFAALNAETTRGTSTFASLNAEITRGTSTFNVANFAYDAASTHETYLFVDDPLVTPLIDRFEAPGSTGTWTPVMAGGTTAGTYGFSTQVGYYAKVGKIVTVNWTVTIANTTTPGTGVVTITGLPFVADTSTLRHGGSLGGISGLGTLPTNWSMWGIRQHGTSSMGLIHFLSTAGTQVGSPISVLSNTFSCTGSFTYRTAS